MKLIRKNPKLDLKMTCIIKTIHLCNLCCSLEVKVWDINLADKSYFIFTLKTNFIVSEHIETQEFHLNIRKHFLL